MKNFHQLKLVMGAVIDGMLINENKKKSTSILNKFLVFNFLFL